jgi:putative cell wall-binding protein
MSLENRVFKTLFKESKTELSTQKIELAAPQFNKFGQRAQSIYLDSRNLAQKNLINVKESLDKGDRTLITLSNELNSEIERITKQAKLIGVDIKETSVFKNIKKAKEDVAQYENSFKKSIANAKGLKL